MSALIVLLGALAVFLSARRLSGVERRYIGLLFIAHVVSANLLVWLFASYYGYGDIDGYVLYGKLIAHLLSTDPLRFLPEVMKVVLHLENGLPFEPGGTGSTGTTCAITGLIMFLIGPTQLGTGLVVSVFSLLGQLSLYKVAREVVLAEERTLALISTLFVPSVVFWSSGILKEALAIGFLGFLCWGAFFLSRGRIVVGLLALIIGTVGVGVLKPYILFPFVLACGAWLFTARSRNTRWTGRGLVYGALATGAAFGAIFVLGRIFPAFSLEGVGETAAHLQGAGEGVRTANDSYVAIGDASQTSLLGQAPYLPLALFNSLFRPLLVEVRGPVILAAALEMSAVTVLVFIIVVRVGRQATRDAIRSSPIIAFCLVFAVACGAGVGIATTNMGTLSRYRVPMMPFYVTALLLIYRRSSRAPDIAVHQQEADDPEPEHLASG